MCLGQQSTSRVQSYEGLVEIYAKVTTANRTGVLSRIAEKNEFAKTGFCLLQRILDGSRTQEQFTQVCERIQKPMSPEISYQDAQTVLNTAKASIGIEGHNQNVLPR